MSVEEREALADSMAMAFHDTHQTLAIDFGWEDQHKPRVEWADLPESQRELLAATFEALIMSGIVK